MGMYPKKIKRIISVLVAMLIVLLYVMPCRISFAATRYGFQGKAGNSIRMNSYDVSVIEETDEYYLNSINEPLNASKSIKFAITMSAGMNSYGDGSNFRRNCMPHIKIYDSSESHVVAEYDDGNGLFKYYYFDNDTKNIYIGVDKGVLPEGDYVLVFGSDVCGNNVAKKLGVPVKFKFSTYLGEPGDGDEDNKPDVPDVPVEPPPPEGFQGKNGNAIKMMTYDITVLEEAETYYLNSINAKINGKEDVVFGFTMSKGMNSFGDGTGFKNNSMQHIKIYDGDWKEVVEEYDGGSGKLKYLDYDPSTQIIYIGLDKDVLPKGDYTLVFGKDVCGNNVERTLGVPVAFKFTIDYPKDEETEDPDNPGGSGGTEDPDDPDNPDNPDNPEDPDNPDNPGESGGTEDPDNPEEPEAPNEPEDPDTPEEPEAPNEPEDPDTPEKPEAPNEPEDPDTPEEPEAPNEPEDPDTPEEPEDPNEPEDPDTPEKPEDKNESEDPDEPNDSEKVDENKEDNNDSKKEEKTDSKKDEKQEQQEEIELDENVNITEVAYIGKDPGENDSQDKKDSDSKGTKNYKVPENVYNTKVVSVKLPEIESNQLLKDVVIVGAILFVIGAVGRGIKFYFDI